jgi:hypothetical protein
VREFRIHPWLFAVVTAAAVVLIGVVAALVTHLAHEGPEKQCVVNCPPPVFTKAAGDEDYQASDARAFADVTGFGVSYTSNWKVHPHGRGLVTFDTDDGGFFEVRVAPAANLPQLITQRLKALNPQTFPDLKVVGPIRGAHIGGTAGTGTLYGGTMVPGGGGGSAERIRFAIIAAKRGNVALLVTAGDWYDRNVTSQIPTGMADAPAIDYTLAQLRWPR